MTDSRRVSPTPSLLSSSALSLATSVLPLLVAVVALPVLTRQLGTERLGLLSLAWAWLGYATLLDLGLGRALTRLVAASDTAAPGSGSVRGAVATAHRTLALLGAVVGMTGACLAPWYVTHVLSVTASLRTDAIASAIVFALTVPAITGASVPRAVLEATQQFRRVNLIRLPVGVGTFAVPLLLLPFTVSLTAIASILAAIRVWAWWRYSVHADTQLPRTGHDAPSRAHLRPLLKAGAWMTVSNVLSPLMTVADRFLIGSLVSVSAVALYAVPWEAVTKLWVVPGALTMVLFPAAARASTMTPETLAPLHAIGVRIVTLIVVPACAIAALLASPALRFFGGAQYLGESVLVLRILAVGVAANCIATIPFTLLQATGRARFTALLHLGEVIPFLVVLWLLVDRYGIVGAAVAWTTRVVVDAAVLLWRAQAVAPLQAGTLWLSGTGIVVIAGCAWIGQTSAFPLTTTLPIAVVLAAMLALTGWTRRTPAERAVLEHAGHRP